MVLPKQFAAIIRICIHLLMNGSKAGITKKLQLSFQKTTATLSIYY